MWVCGYGWKWDLHDIWVGITEWPICIYGVHAGCRRCRWRNWWRVIRCTWWTRRRTVASTCTSPGSSFPFWMSLTLSLRMISTLPCPCSNIEFSTRILNLLGISAYLYGESRKNARLTRFSAEILYRLSELAQLDSWAITNRQWLYMPLLYVPDKRLMWRHGSPTLTLVVRLDDHNWPIAQKWPHGDRSWNSFWQKIYRQILGSA